MLIEKKYRLAVQIMAHHHRGIGLVALLGVFVFVTACAPTVKLEPPEKPIEINVNVKIDQEVRIKLDRAVEEALKSDPGLFGLE